MLSFPVELYNVTARARARAEKGASPLRDDLLRSRREAVRWRERRGRRNVRDERERRDDE